MTCRPVVVLYVIYVWVANTNRIRVTQPYIHMYSIIQPSATWSASEQALELILMISHSSSDRSIFILLFTQQLPYQWALQSTCTICNQTDKGHHWLALHRASVYRVDQSKLSCKPSRHVQLIIFMLYIYIYIYIQYFKLQHNYKFIN